MKIKTILAVNGCQDDKKREASGIYHNKTGRNKLSGDFEGEKSSDRLLRVKSISWYRKPHFTDILLFLVLVLEIK